ncbi:MAG: PHP domain-containing protein [Peptococcaceae bacterium]|nr:PHP domain-containing protein [Peptococcaceae bacterium]
MKADLHIHSTVSDGSDTIDEIIGIAQEKGLDVIALTEHDTLSHLTQIPEQFPGDTGLRILGGVEISGIHRPTNTRAHVLGYNIQKPELVARLTQPVLEARHRNSVKQATLLVQAGYEIDLAQLAQADGKYLYKQHIMDWLVTTGQVPEMFGDFYYRTFKQGGMCAFDIEYADVFEAVKTVKEAGGLAVLAHPGQQQSFWLIPELAEAGLDGLELNHHTSSPQDKQIMREYAQQYKLFLTGGSDYHGLYEPQPFGVGDFLAEESGVRAICRQ